MASDTQSLGGSASAARDRVGGAWAWFLGAVGVATAAYFFLPTEAQSSLDNAIAVAAAIAMFVGILIHRPEPRFAWVLLALGVLLLALGDIAYGTTQPVPSLADVFYVSAYPLLGLGLVVLARARIPGPKGSPVLVAVVLAAGVGVVSLLFLALPAGQEREVGMITRLVSIGYPVMDLVLIGLLSGPVRSALTRGLPALLMGAALLFRLAGDTGFVFLNFGTGYTVGNVADAAWIISFGAFGAAVLHPHIARQNALLRPSAAWTRVPVSAVTSRFRPDGQTLVLRGLTGAPVAVAGLAGPPAAAAVSANWSITWGQAVRFRLILLWAGLMLVGLAGAAIFVSITWQAPAATLLGGAYGLMGSLTLIAGSIRS